MQGGGEAKLRLYWTRPGKHREALSRALLLPENPANATSLRIYRIRRTLLSMLTFFWGGLIVVIGSGIRGRISRKFLLWNEEFRNIAVLLVILLGSRILYFQQGIHFDDQPPCLAPGQVARQVADQRQRD